MKKYNWSYTQFSQFNADDSLLLVSGVFMGPRSSSSGEIAVIGLGKETCRAPSETLESPDAPQGRASEQLRRMTGWGSFLGDLWGIPGAAAAA